MRDLPKITKNLLYINVIMFLATMAAGKIGLNLNEYLGLHLFIADDFKPMQIVTYMFMHGGFMHLFFNMFGLFMFCSVSGTM